MAGNSENFCQWLSAALDSLDLDGEIYVGYVEGILQDESEPLDDRLESVVEILSGATEKVIDDSFRVDLQAQWKATQEAASDAAAVQTAELLAKQEEQQRRDLELAAQGQEAIQREATKNNLLTLDERRARERLIEEYGCADDTDTVDEDGNVTLGKAESTDDTLSAAGMNMNSNRTQVKEMEKNKRDGMKAAHAKEHERNKLQQVQEKVKKEKEKRRTQKRERRR